MQRFDECLGSARVTAAIGNIPVDPNPQRLRSYTEDELSKARAANDPSALVQRRELANPDQYVARSFGWQRGVYFSPKLLELAVHAPGGGGVAAVLRGTLGVLEAAGCPAAVPVDWTPISFALPMGDVDVDLVVHPVSSGRGVTADADLFWYIRTTADSARSFYTPAWIDVG